MASVWLLFLAGTGALTLGSLIYNVFDFLSFHLFTPSRPVIRYSRGNKPAYALITGSSAGIGLGIAQALAKQGFNLILLAHIASELSEAVARIRELQPDIDVRVIVMDARTATPEEMEAAVQSIADLDVTILVNNIGGNPIAHPPFRPFGTYSSTDVDAVINQNARFMARLTALLLPVLSRKPTGPEQCSLVLNVSSMAWYGTPWMAMYTATKSFNLAMTWALAREFTVDPAISHVKALAVIPGEVRSQGNNQADSDRAVKWDQYGQLIVNKMDQAVKRGMRDMSPHWLQDIQRRILVWLPEGVRTQAMIDMIKMKRDVFNAVYKKKD
jgi:17beta-estradiol 17-dehydrogenase / very-long-chain 3-oxoacyl-CoA reductase